MSVTKEQIEQFIQAAIESDYINLGNNEWVSEISNYLRHMPTEETQFKTSNEFVAPTKEKITWVCLGAGGVS